MAALSFAKRVYRLRTIFNRRRTYSVFDKCSRCGASSLWADKETPRNYCNQCGSRYIGLWRHIKVQLFGFVRGF